MCCFNTTKQHVSIECWTPGAAAADRNVPLCVCVQSHRVASLWLMTPLSVMTSLRRSSRCTFPCKTHTSTLFTHTHTLDWMKPELTLQCQDSTPPPPPHLIRRFVVSCASTIVTGIHKRAHIWHLMHCLLLWEVKHGGSMNSECEWKVHQCKNVAFLQQQTQCTEIAYSSQNVML